MAEVELGADIVNVINTGPTISSEPLENAITLAEMEELVVKHQEEGIHKVRSKGQLEAAAELRRVAYSDMRDILYTDKNGNMCIRELTELPPEITRTIKKIKVRRERSTKPRVYDEDGQADDGSEVIGEIVEIELWDKMNALDKLMKHYGGYELDNAQKVDPLQRSLDSLLTSISDEGLPKLKHDPYKDDKAKELEYDGEYDEWEDEI
jgi:hypothetical protein